MKRGDVIPVLALAALCVAMGFVPAAHPLADDSGEPVRARVVAVDDSTLTFTGLYSGEQFTLTLETTLRAEVDQAVNEIVLSTGD